MTAHLLLLLVSTLVGVAALLVAVDGPAPIRVTGPSSPGRGTRALGAVLAATVVVALSGWVLAGAVIGGGAWNVVGRVQQRRRRPAGEIEMTEALAAWIEHLRDVLIAGDQPIGAIGATVATCPPALRPHVRRLSTRLARVEPSVAFRRFADDVDDPLGDLVAAGLLIAVERGARTVGVLTALAEQARHQADRRRIVAAERAPVRREVGVLTAIMAALVVALFVFGRAEYLSPYDAPAGQAYLAVCLALYGALLLRVQQLAHQPRPARFLGSSGDATGTTGRSGAGRAAAARQPVAPSHGASTDAGARR